jgi:hypothetical protein
MTQKDTLDFIVIGAQKSGTTSLFQYLRHHPEIALPAGKELPYFSHEAMYTRGWDAYIQAVIRDGFEGAADATRMWGTVTPQYMMGGVEGLGGKRPEPPYDARTVPARIRERLPDVRLIAILRDPVARAVSHHRMLVSRGQDRRSFDEAMKEMLTPEALRSARAEPADATGRVVMGEYGRLLEGYFEMFPREQILVVFTQELEDAAAQLLHRIHEFIGVRADFEPENIGARYHVGAAAGRGFSWASPSTWLTPSSPVSPQGLQRALRRNRASRALWHALPIAQQRRLRRPYERVAGRVHMRNWRASPNEVSANTPPTPATLQRLREHYEPDGRRLAEMIGEPLPWLSDPS